MTRVATRDEQIAEARRLRADEATYAQIAEHLGVSITTAQRWTNDGYAERNRAASRAAKESYRGTCKACGRSTNGSDGPGTASDTCARCRWQQRRDEAVWTPERLVAEAYRWYRLVGRFPVCTDWHSAEGPPRSSPGRRQAAAQFHALTGPWPPAASVNDHFGTWARFIQTLGGTPVGSNRGIPWGLRERELRAAIDRIQQQGGTA